MLIQKLNPVGADKNIQAFQKMLHDQLLAKWGLTTEKFHSYGRVYKNQRANGMYVPEWYEGENNYKEVHFDDIPVYSFFGVADRSEFNESQHLIDAYLVFRVDLSKVRPLITHRADEEIHADIQDIIRRDFHGFEYKSMETGVRAAFKEYSKWVESNQFNDMHPWHICRFNLSLKY